MSRMMLFVVLLAFTSGMAATAAEMSAEDIICGLDPGCTRPVVRSPRGLTVSGRTINDPIAVDLYVNFAFDSAELKSDARITLDRLGSALQDSRLDGFDFMIAGHTDAKGSAAYNQKLSLRRAEAVRHYMITQFGIEPKRLSARGYGKTLLLDPSRPEDEVNRRVQVLNVTASAKH